MIPLQDVVPTGRVPGATLTLIVLNVLAFVLGPASPHWLAVAPLLHPDAVSLIVALVFLWIFGDNVEARLGRALFVAIYLAGGYVAAAAPLAYQELAPVPLLGAAGSVTAVLGAYFVMLPTSRVLLLVPVPDWLVEVPAGFFLAAWVLLLMVTIVLWPGAMRLGTSETAASWGLLTALATGAAVSRIARPAIRW